MRLLAALVLCAVSVTATTADARPRKSKAPVAGQARIVALLERLAADNAKMRQELAAIRQQLRPDAHASAAPMPPGRASNPLLAVAPMPIPDPRAAPTLTGYSMHIEKNAKVKTLTPVLAGKVREILDACPGARLTSAHRPGARVRGSGRLSLHSHYPAKAADMAGNPACIVRHLAKWPGGLSTDYAAVRHYHISYAPKSREWGARFAHYGSRKARKSRHVYAAAQ